MQRSMRGWGAIVAVLVIALMAMPAMAVVERSWSIVAGTGASTLYGDSVFQGTEPAPSFIAGVGLEVPLLSVLSIRTGLQYAEKGAEVRDNEVFGPFEQELTYLQAPFLAALSLGQVVATVGPVVGYTLRANLSDPYADVDPRVNDFDVGLATGLAIRYHQLELGGVYNTGLSVTNAEGADIQQKNEAFHFVVAYHLRL